jgi:hypothetical protein
MGIDDLANQAKDFTSDNAEGTSGSSLSPAKGARN